MSNELTVRPQTETALTAADIRQQVNLIQTVMKEVMQGPSAANPNGVHYGIIPGTGKKMVLLKPGAEKLAMTFRLRPVIDNDRDISIAELPNGHREVRVYCHIINSSGLELSTGVGSCSTMETKYRYRGGEKVPTGNPVPKEYWNLKKDGRINEAQELIGGRGFGAAKVEGQWQICEMGEKAENPDVADTYNTVLKMAKKRAFIDGILSATAASDIFTQDFEDMPIPIPIPIPTTQPEHKERVEIKQPQEMKEPVAQPPVSDGKPKISDAQIGRLMAIANKNNVTADAIKNYLREKGIEHIRDITRGRVYDEVCAWTENGGQLTPEERPF